MGVLESVQKIYDFQSSKFDYAALETYQAQFEETYSDYPLLVSIVNQMLITDQESRPNFRKLQKALPKFESLEPELVNKPAMYNSKFKKNGFGAKVDGGPPPRNRSPRSSNISLLRNALESEKNPSKEGASGTSGWMHGKGYQVGQSPGGKGKGLAYTGETPRDHSGLQQTSSSRSFQNQPIDHQIQAHYNQKQRNFNGTDYSEKSNQLQNIGNLPSRNIHQRPIQNQQNSALIRGRGSPPEQDTRQGRDPSTSVASRWSRNQTPNRNPLLTRVTPAQFPKRMTSNNINSRTTHDPHRPNRRHTANINFSNHDFSHAQNIEEQGGLVSSQSNSLHHKYSTLQAPLNQNQNQNQNHTSYSYLKHQPSRERIRGTYPNYQTHKHRHSPHQQYSHYANHFERKSIGSKNTNYQNHRKQEYRKSQTEKIRGSFNNRQSYNRHQHNDNSHSRNGTRAKLTTQARKEGSRQGLNTNPETLTMNKNYEHNFMTSGETNFVINADRRGRTLQPPPALDIHSINRNISASKGLTFSKSPKEQNKYSDFKSLRHNQVQPISTQNHTLKLNMTPNRNQGRHTTPSPQPVRGKSTVQNKTGKKRRKKSASIFDSSERHSREMRAGLEQIEDFPRYSEQPVPKEFFTLRETGLKRYCSNTVNDCNGPGVSGGTIFDAVGERARKLLKKQSTRSFTQNIESHNGYSKQYVESSSSRPELGADQHPSQSRSRGTPVANIKIPPLSGLTSPGTNLNGHYPVYTGTSTSRGISSQTYTNERNIYNQSPGPHNKYQGHVSQKSHPLQKTLKSSEPLRPDQRAPVGMVKQLSQKVIKHVGNWFSGSDERSESYTQRSTNRHKGYAEIVRAQGQPPQSSGSSRFQSSKGQTSKYHSKGSILSRREFSSGTDGVKGSSSRQHARVMSSINEIDKSSEVSEGRLQQLQNTETSHIDSGSGGQSDANINDTNSKNSNKRPREGIETGQKRHTGTFKRKSKIDIFGNQIKVSKEPRRQRRNSRNPSTLILKLNGRQPRRNSNRVIQNIVKLQGKKASEPQSRDSPSVFQDISNELSLPNNRLNRKTISGQNSLKQNEDIFNSKPRNFLKRNSMKQNRFAKKFQKRAHLNQQNRPSNQYNSHSINTNSKSEKTKFRVDVTHNPPIRNKKQLYQFESKPARTPHRSFLSPNANGQAFVSNISKSHLLSNGPESKVRVVQLGKNCSNLKVVLDRNTNMDLRNRSISQDREIKIPLTDRERNRTSSVFSKKRDSEDLSKNLSRISNHSKRKNRLRERSESKESRKRLSNIKINHQTFIPNRSRLSRPPIRKKIPSLKAQHYEIPRTQQPSYNKENLRSRSVNKIPTRETEGPQPFTKRTIRSGQKMSDLLRKNTFRKRGDHQSSAKSIASYRMASKLKSDRVSSIQMRIAGGRDSHKSKIISEDSIVCDISSFRDDDSRSAQKVIRKQERYAVSKSIPNKGGIAQARRIRRGNSTNRSTKSYLASQNRVFQRIELGKGSGVRPGRGTGLFRFDTKGKLIQTNLLRSRVSMQSQQINGDNSLQNAQKFRQALQQFVDHGLFKN